MFEILHFRGSDEILKEKRLLKDVQATMQYIDDVLRASEKKFYPESTTGQIVMNHFSRPCSL